MNEPVAPTEQKNKNAFVLLCTLVVFMVCLAYISVPLYKIFCERTGFGGTPKIGTQSSNRATSRKITVQFLGTVHRDLPWSFKPSQNEITVKLGENALAYYQATNNGDTPIVGMATYNVSPDKAGPYFVKVACFCFDEQLLPPHKNIDMPVYFYLDPEMENDPDLKDVKKIVLSYTFFRYQK